MVGLVRVELLDDLSIGAGVAVEGRSPAASAPAARIGVTAAEDVVANSRATVHDEDLSSTSEVPTYWGIS